MIQVHPRYPQSCGIYPRIQEGEIEPGGAHSYPSSLFAMARPPRVSDRPQFRSRLSATRMRQLCAHTAATEHTERVCEPPSLRFKPPPLPEAEGGRGACVKEVFEALKRVRPRWVALLAELTEFPQTDDSGVCASIWEACYLNAAHAIVKGLSIRATAAVRLRGVKLARGAASVAIPVAWCTPGPPAYAYLPYESSPGDRPFIRLPSKLPAGLPPAACIFNTPIVYASTKEVEAAIAPGSCPSAQGMYLWSFAGIGESVYNHSGFRTMPLLRGGFEICEGKAVMDIDRIESAVVALVNRVLAINSIESDHRVPARSLDWAKLVIAAVRESLGGGGGGEEGEGEKDLVAWYMTTVRWFVAAVLGPRATLLKAAEEAVEYLRAYVGILTDSLGYLNNSIDKIPLKDMVCTETSAPVDDIIESAILRGALFPLPLRLYRAPYEAVLPLVATRSAVLVDGMAYFTAEGVVELALSRFQDAWKLGCPKAGAEATFLAREPRLEPVAAWIKKRLVDWDARSSSIATTTPEQRHWDLATIKASAPPCVLVALRGPGHPKNDARWLLRSFFAAAGAGALGALAATKHLYTADGADASYAAEEKQAHGIDKEGKKAYIAKNCTKLADVRLCPFVGSGGGDIEDLVKGLRKNNMGGGWKGGGMVSSEDFAHFTPTEKCSCLVTGEKPKPGAAHTHPYFVFRRGNGGGGGGGGGGGEDTK